MVVAPVTYVTVVAASWAGSFLVQRAFDRAATRLELLPIVCVFGIVIGYGYVMVVAAALALSHRLGWVRAYEVPSP